MVHARRSIDKEDMLLFRDLIGGRFHLRRRFLHVIEIGVLRCLDEGENRALVFFRREFLRR